METKIICVVGADRLATSIILESLKNKLDCQVLEFDSMSQLIESEKIRMSGISGAFNNPVTDQKITADNFVKKLKRLSDIDFFDTTFGPDPTEPCLDSDVENNFKRKNRLSQMGKSPYGPQKLHRKK